jgi:MFS family permease
MLAEATPPPDDASAAGPGDARFAGFATVAFLGVTAGVQMSDRGLQSVLSPEIRATFGVGDAAMGWVFGVAGILIASGLALPLAKLADRYSRKAILIGLILAWMIFTALGGVAATFPLFFAGRAATGVAEFAMIPIVYSLIPDLVAERWRIAANLTFAALMATGASAGFYFGGVLLHLAGHVDLAAIGATSPWRVATVLLSAAGIPLTLVALLLRDPPRGAQASEDAARTSLTDFVVARRREVLLFLGAAGGLAVAVQALTPMAAMAIVRRYHADLEVVGHGLGIVTLITSLATLPIAGVLDKALDARFGRGSRPAIMAGAAVLAAPCAAALAFAATADDAIALIGGFLAFTCLANALIPTMLQDLAPVELRARAFAAYSFLIAAFCAVGPVLSGELSDRFTRGDLTLAIALATTPALLLAAACAAVSLTTVYRPARIAAAQA